MGTEQDRSGVDQIGKRTWTENWIQWEASLGLAGDLGLGRLQGVHGGDSR